MRYAINDVYASIQGEGVQTGVPMVVLRLQGCEVGCPFCDTKETWAKNEADAMATLDSLLAFNQENGPNGRFVRATAQAVASFVDENFEGLAWVLITGGEPADYELARLVAELRKEGFLVAIETSGTALGAVDAKAHHVTVSPKINMPGGRAVLPAALVGIAELKHVVGKQADIDALDKLLDHLAEHDIDMRKTTICLQPMSQSTKATSLAVQTCIERGWRLSIQVHKQIDVA